MYQYIHTKKAVIETKYPEFQPFIPMINDLLRKENQMYQEKLIKSLCKDFSVTQEPKFKYRFYHDLEQRVTIYKLTIGKTTLISFARCHPKDKWDTVIGNRTALTDAMRNVSKQTREKIWEHFWERNKKPEKLEE